MSELSIVFVNYKSVSLLESCLKSLKFQVYKKFEIFVVDNGSNERDFIKIKSFNKIFRNNFKITVLKPKFNLGFAGGNNYAIKNINSPYILLLNCDTEIKQTDSLQLMIEYMKKHPKVGMLSPKICFFSDPTRIWYAGANLNPRSLYFSYHIGLNRLDRGQYNEIKSTSYACGAALLVCRDVIKKVKLMDEIFFMYSEETDWNYRAKKSGFQIIYYPPATVLHKVKTITTKNRWGFRENPFQMYLYNRNRIILVIKNFSISDIIIFFCTSQLRTTFAEIIISFLLNKPDFLLSYIRAIVMGIIIGIRRRTNQKCNEIIVKEMKYILKFNKISNSTIVR